MKAVNILAANRRIRSARTSIALSVLRVLWRLVRVPLLAVLFALEPIASVILTAVGVLGITAALILRSSHHPPQFSIWGMLGFSVCALVVLSAYDVLLGMLSR